MRQKNEYNVHQKKTSKAISMALMAAVLYGISAPLSKLLLVEIQPKLMAGLLYLGAGLGMTIFNVIQNGLKKTQKEAGLKRKDMPYVLGMVGLDIAAPILLLMGLSITPSGSVVLLNNFEIVVTSLIALVIFKEAIGKRMWISIVLITVGTFILSIEDLNQLTFSTGALFVLAATLCWGFENNCTRMLSLSNPLQIVIIKGFGSGIGAILIAFFVGETSSKLIYILLTMLLGFISYGLSIFCYIYAQRELGAARTSAFYAVAPFVGVFTSWVMLKETIHLNFMIALSFMIAGSYFGITELHGHKHGHEYILHEHNHSHDDLHHTHFHTDDKEDNHSHIHEHEAIYHSHSHMPDMHHRHSHKEN